jgi:hypothetical protein
MEPPAFSDIAPATTSTMPATSRCSGARPAGTAVRAVKTGVSDEGNRPAHRRELDGVDESEAREEIQARAESLKKVARPGSFEAVEGEKAEKERNRRAT